MFSGKAAMKFRPVLSAVDSGNRETFSQLPNKDISFVTTTDIDKIYRYDTKKYIICTGFSSVHVAIKYLCFNEGTEEIMGNNGIMTGNI